MRNKTVLLSKISLKRESEYLNTVRLSHIHGRTIKLIKEAKNGPTHENMAVDL